ncbi:hypothetical protein C6P45_004634 [Maudiozyma exigua]|uniref:Peptidase A1 domain-containing protein n=1 Tax=Maudiozyma exigua TaxID=34358 RepID=A0A9P7BBL1_MAUEX|nr:hypothetical protein C6P45_004634 [Kazachstania exigua]
MTKLTNLLFALSAAFTNEVNAFNIPNEPIHRGDVNPVTPSKRGYVGLDFTKTYGDNFDGSISENKPELYLHKRNDGYESIEITNQLTFYSVSLEIGTPAQNITVLVDTGSSDLWVSNSDNPYCQSNYDINSGISFTNTINCEEYGTFDPSASSSWSSNSTIFNINYGDTTFARGVWDLNVTGLSFAVANRSNSTVGVLGIGLPGLEVTYTGAGTGRSYQYDNFPLVLKRSGAIESNVYSLYLNDSDSSHGTVLFGAVDHSKYEGSLNTIPLVNTLKANGFQSAVQFDVTLQGIGMTFENGTSDKTLTTTKIPALLDSGTTLTYLPDSIVSVIAKQIGVSFSSRLGYYTIPCPETSSKTAEMLDSTQLVFDFGGFYINATLKDFLVRASETTCLLGIVPQTAHSALLGDSFLSNAYVVYDLENKEISLAQAKYDSNTPNIEVVSSGASSIPSATRAPLYSQTWSTSVTSIGTTGNIFTVQEQDAGASRSADASTTNSATSGSNTRSSTSSRRTSSNSTNRKNEAGILLSTPFPMGFVSMVAFYLAMLL